MNIENLNHLRNFMLAGAPEVILDMHLSLVTVEEADYESEYFVDNQEMQIAELPSKADCGTACCVAGAAHLMSVNSDGTFPSPQEQFELTMRAGGWETTRDTALNWLGLETDEDSFYGHRLFNPQLAPAHCTPSQAAVAIQNVMNGQEPWQ